MSAQVKPGNETTPESGRVETGPTGSVATALDLFMQEVHLCPVTASGRKQKYPSSR